MAKSQSKIQVRFEPVGHKALITAIKKLNSVQKQLENNVKKLNQSYALGKNDVDKYRMRVEANTKAAKKNGTALTRLQGFIAKYRNQLLLAAFAINAYNRSIGRLTDAYAVQELAEKKLGSALGFTSQRLLDFASAQQKVTTFGDEVTISAMSQVAAFTKSESAIQKIITASQDFASATGMDFQSTTNLITKSIFSSTNALSRYGIEIDNTLKGQERINALTEKINELFGGQAVAQTQTFAGAQQQLSNAFGDLQENLGEVLAEGLLPIVKALTDLTEKLNEISGSTILQTIGAIGLLFIGNTKKAKGFTKSLNKLESTAAALAFTFGKLFRFLRGFTAVGFISSLFSQYADVNKKVAESIEEITDTELDKFLNENAQDVDSLRKKLEQLKDEEKELDRQRKGFEVDKELADFYSDDKFLVDFYGGAESSIGGVVSVLALMGNAARKAVGDMLQGLEDLIGVDFDIPIIQGDPFGTEKASKVAVENIEKVDKAYNENSKQRQQTQEVLNAQLKLEEEAAIKTIVPLHNELLLLREKHKLSKEELIIQKFRIANSEYINNLNEEDAKTLESLLEEKVMLLKVDRQLADLESKAMKAMADFAKSKEKDLDLAKSIVDSNKTEQEQILEQIANLEKAIVVNELYGAELFLVLDALNLLDKELEEVNEGLSDFAKTATEAQKNLAGAVETGFMTILNRQLDDGVMKMREFGDAVLAEMQRIATSNIARKLGELLISFLNPGGGFLDFFFGHSGGQVPEMHSGGMVASYHSGGMAQDVPAILQEGEFVMRRSAVESIGIENLNRMNQTGQSGININFSGNVLSQDFIETEAIPAIKKAVRRGADLGIS